MIEESIGVFIELFKTDGGVCLLTIAFLISEFATKIFLQNGVGGARYREFINHYAHHRQNLRDFNLIF